MLVKDGFQRPTWVTTGRPLTDATYNRISSTQFHLARAEDNVLAHIEYGGNSIGVLVKDFETALADAEQGVLVVGPPEIAAQVLVKVPKTLIFALKEAETDLSEHLDDASRTGQLHRIDIDVLEPGVWTDVYSVMMTTIGLPVRKNPF
jgi:hypothetical protein